MFLAGLHAIASTTETSCAARKRGYSVWEQNIIRRMIKRPRIICRSLQQSGAEISSRRRSDWSIARHSLGVTLIEIFIALAIVGILSAVSVRLYDRYLYRADVAQAKLDIHSITLEIARYQLANDDELPDDLATIGKGGLVDPWGNPYQYLNISAGNNLGNIRKNKNLVPINSDYDLYSKGPDGLSQGPLTAKASRDDIVRASNGRFIGVASDY